MSKRSFPLPHLGNQEYISIQPIKKHTYISCSNPPRILMVLFLEIHILRLSIYLYLMVWNSTQRKAPFFRFVRIRLLYNHWMLKCLLFSVRKGTPLRLTVNFFIDSPLCLERVTNPSCFRFALVSRCPELEILRRGGSTLY
ncbi:MAG: hypothetical protein K0S76_2962 [Herbinix sp.]|nr:hypothetical protein [Herbinix sp.]